MLRGAVCLVTEAAALLTRLLGLASARRRALRVATSAIMLGIGPGSPGPSARGTPSLKLQCAADIEDGQAASPSLGAREAHQPERPLASRRPPSHMPSPRGPGRPGHSASKRPRVEGCRGRGAVGRRPAARFELEARNVRHCQPPGRRKGRRGLPAPCFYARLRARAAGGLGASWRPAGPGRRDHGALPR